MIQRNKKHIKKANMLPAIMLITGFAGFSLFYLIPFVVSFIYAMVDNPIHMEFVGFNNFIELFHNEYFFRGLKNTVIFMMISIPINMILSLGIALWVNKLGSYSRWFSLVFLIPLVIPSATTAFFWNNIFRSEGALNKILATFGIQGPDWIQSRYGMLVMILIFVWKNVGYNMMLFLSGLSGIPKQYYECAALEGAGKFQRFHRITMVYLMPTTFLVFIMSFVNSFKVFREIYIITGEYPPDNLYLLQHYMNNMFLSLNYPKLVSAVYILTVVIVLIVVCIFRAENKISEDIRN